MEVEIRYYKVVKKIPKRLDDYITMKYGDIFPEKNCLGSFVASGRYFESTLGEDFQKELTLKMEAYEELLSEGILERCSSEDFELYADEVIMSSFGHITFGSDDIEDK